MKKKSIYTRSLIAIAADLVGIVTTASSRMTIALADLEVSLSDASKR